MVEGAFGDPRPLDDIIDGGVLVASGKEQRLRAIEEFAATDVGRFDDPNGFVSLGYHE